MQTAQFRHCDHSVSTSKCCRLQSSGSSAMGVKRRKLSHQSYTHQCWNATSAVLQHPAVVATQRSRHLQTRSVEASKTVCKSSIHEHMEGHADPVISSAWLAEHLEDVAILDVRGSVRTKLQSTNAQGCRLEMSEYFADYDTYLEGHIPGATFFDWTKDGVDEDEETPVQLQIDSDTFAAEMEAKGVGTDRPVVVYDSGNGLLAPRVWWCLSYHGHPAPLILDGGYARWVEEGRSTDLAEPCPLMASPDLQQWHTGCNLDQKPASQQATDKARQSGVYATFEPQPQPHRRATSGDMLQALDDKQDGKDIIILDARGLEQYTGEVKRAERGGHIPGALNISRKSLLDKSTGLLRPLQDQRQVFEDAGVDCSGNGSQQIYTYCNGGVASCSLALALDRLGLGQKCANYDGSWNEWGNELQLPVQTGK